MALTVEKLLTQDISKPARYLGKEMGSIHKTWETSTVRWVLTYPEVYEVGASNLGHIILYNILNRQAEQLCDRAYLPASDLAKKLRETQTPLWGLEARRPLMDYDILGFSLSYELGATNILEMLDLAGIPLSWKERLNPTSKNKNKWSNLEYPLIFAGGQTATSNPEPYTKFFDLMVLGDGEDVLPEMGAVIRAAKEQKLDRTELLLNLAQVPGVYVPQFYHQGEDGSVYPNRPDVPPRIIRRVATPNPEDGIGLIPYIETVHDRLVVEVRRGCTRGCRFCQPGMLTRPARDVSPEKVVNAIEKGINETGYNELSLLSLSCSDYLSLPAVGMELRNRLKDKNISISLPSQRVDRFDDNIANIIGGRRKTSLTFAPEAGTQRLRDVINKGLTNEELLRGIKTAVEQGWDKIKLYFMIGLPGETDADLLGIAETLRWLKRECRIQGRKPLNFTVTISNFTPKPHTPFQWHSVSTEEFRRKQKLLRAELRHIRGVKANFTDIRFSAMEDFLGRGDRSLAPVIRRAWELGAGMDAWMENLDQAFGAWEKAIEECGLSWKYRQIQEGEWNVIQTENTLLEKAEGKQKRKTEYNWDQRLNAPLPWDHINTGIDKEWLKTDLQKALEAATVPDCAFEGCSQCGICGVEFGHNIVSEVPPIPPFQGDSPDSSTRSQRLRIRFGKQGELRLLGHLDLVRLFDRALRRSGLPISFSGGFHPKPRIAITSALSLGMTSSGELVDIELTEKIAPEEFLSQFAQQLPAEIPLYSVEEVDIKTLPTNRLLQQAEYLLTLQTQENYPQNQWELWLKQVLNQSEIPFLKQTKSGKKQQINLRDRLISLSLKEYQIDRVKINYIGSCQNDGTVLHPEHIIYMLEKSSGTEITLLQAHRQQLILQKT